MAQKSKLEAQNPLILRCHRLMEAFAKSDDERDFYLDRFEGFIIYVDLDKPQADLEILENELKKNRERYCLIPKLTFYETKKIMEGFVNEKVYDIDTKEKLLDIIQSKEARENFLEFIYDHHSELEKWQQFYQERSRIRIIEWLRINHFHFVFEEDLDLNKSVIEKLKRNLFEAKVGKDIALARKTLVAKAKTYYSNEALNPRPKRGRPPKQAIKLEVEPQVTTDIYTTVPATVRLFLFIPDFSSSSAVTFSSKFETEEQMLAGKKHLHNEAELSLESINQKLAELRNISKRWIQTDEPVPPVSASKQAEDDEDIDLEEDDFDEEEDTKKINGFSRSTTKSKKTTAQSSIKSTPKKTPSPTSKAKKTIPVTKPAKLTNKQPPKVKLIPKEKTTGKVKAKINNKRK
jgi:Uncharacterised protein family (UPF0158)